MNNTLKITIGLLLIFQIISNAQPTAVEKIEQGIDSLFRYNPNLVGLQMAVLRDDSVIINEGYGLTNLEKNQPINAKSKFYIASSTKSFVGMLGAILAQSGDLDLDTCITKYFPDLEFKQHNLNADKISLRDHFGHRTGYENDLLAYLPPVVGSMPTDRMVHLLSNFSREVPITFNYSNESYTMAAAAMEKATGKSWKRLLREYIFDPLELKNTGTNIDSMKMDRNFALPHDFINGRMRVTEPKSNTNMHAAGGMISNARDLIQWMKVIANQGRHHEQQVIDDQAVKEALSIQTRLQAMYYNRYRRYAYAFGWYHSTYRQEQVLHHFGGFTGYHCHMSFMPEKGLAVAVLANSGTLAPQLIASYIYDILLGQEDAENFYHTLMKEGKSSREWNHNKDQVRKEWIQPNDEPNRYKKSDLTGLYESERLGKIEIRISNDNLAAVFGEKRSELKNIGGDTYLISWSAEKYDFDLEAVIPNKLIFEIKNGILVMSLQSNAFGLIGTFNQVE